MDQKRLFMAIAISVAILLGFQILAPKPPPRPVVEATKTTPTAAVPPPSSDPAFPGTQPIAVAPPLSAQRDVPRLRIAAPRGQGSINLAGARVAGAAGRSAALLCAIRLERRGQRRRARPRRDLDGLGA